MIYIGPNISRGLAREVGEVIAWAGSGSVPQGWLECDGTTYNDGDHPALEAVIGSTFGTGGAGTWKVPDMRGRTPIGTGTGTGLTARALGAQVGAETHQLTAAEMPSHDHSGSPATIQGYGGTGSIWPKEDAGLGAGANSLLPVDLTLASEGGDGAHNNVQPSLALRFLIRATP